MKSFKKILLFAASFLFLLAVFKFQLLAVDCPRNEEELEGKSLQDLVDIEEACQKKIENLQGQQKTLASAIGFLNNKVQLTITQITTTEEQLKILVKEIADLSVKINILDSSITDVSAILTSRIEATYKRERIKPVYLFFVSQGFSDFFNRIQYLKAAQLHDRQLLYGMQKSKMNYDSQKDLKKEKQTLQENLKKKLETQKATLAQQKQAKQELLEITKNDEKTFQGLIAEAQQEISALLASKFTGKRHVDKGEVIGLMGNTGFSFGSHLHFGVYNLSENEAGKFNYFSDAGNPLNYLISKSFTFQTNSCDDVPAEQTKTVGSGNWTWPMENPTISQCYGHTPYSFRYSNNFHNGIDMYNTYQLSVRSIEEGEAYFYRGDSSMGNNVRVFHPDGKMTLYLHLQ